MCQRIRPSTKFSDGRGGCRCCCAATGRPTEVTSKESAESTSKRKKRPKRTVTPDLTTAPELIYLKCLEKDGSQGASVKVLQPRRRPSKDKGIIMASKKQKKGVAQQVAVKPGSSKKPLGTGRRHQ